MMNGFTRRDFLRAGAVGASSLSIPGWLLRAVADPAAAASRKTLVLIMLGGGNDGLSTVAPLSDPLYQKARPTLAYPKDQLLKVSDSVGLNPGLRKLRDLFDEGKVAVLHNVGYPNQDRSHFRSMEIWQTGQMQGAIRDGWLGRCLHDDNGCPHSVSFGSEVPLALLSDGGGILSMENPYAFDVANDQRHQNDRPNIVRAFREIYALPREGRAELVRTRGLDLLAQIDRVKAIAAAPNPPVNYPNSPLAQGLRFIANAIEADLGARVYMIGLGGFDTHANQKGQHQNLMQQLAEALYSFQKDLDAREMANMVVTMTFSEFGRRVAENQSQGTDHGAASAMFIVGKKIHPGVYGDAPRLDMLDDGDLAWKIDFRSVYAAVLEKWLGIGSEAVLGGKFAPVAAL